MLAVNNKAVPEKIIRDTIRQSFYCVDNNMIKSMTAFAHQSVEAPWGILECELRSVNHRYLDLQLRLPDELRSHEKNFRDTISKKVKRGKLECIFRLTPDHSQNNEIQVNEDQVSAVLSACKIISTKMHQPSEINPLEVLSWPGVIQEKRLDQQTIIDKSTELLTAVLDDFIASRSEEGARLQDILQQRCQTMEKIVREEKHRQADLLQRYRDKLLDRLKEISIQHDADRLEQELVYLANKMDVSEELDRLQSHFKEIENILKRDEPVGRRLDFIMQELNREANTLGSKSVDIETTQASVELKVLIEQMREQVQNIE